MKGDFTRDTFDQKKQFSRVLMQQGRVQLDADWNEQTAILLHYIRTLAKDILGPRAGPKGEAGFEIVTRETKDWANMLTVATDERRREALRKAVAGGDLVIGPGRYYVEGVLVENDRAVLYTEQSGDAFNEAPALEALAKDRGGLLVYLDVWERHITYVEDDDIREAALGGPDTCSRAQVVWQVKLLFPTAATPQFNCDAVNTLPAFGTGTLRARARRDKPPVELCVIPPESRYRGAENQLYRVEVHEGGTAAGDGNRATFKWSRENGSVVFPIRSMSDSIVSLEHLGRDQHLGLKPGDWVEVIDDVIAVGEQAGPLAQVDVVDRDELTVSLKLPQGTSSLPSYGDEDFTTKHPLLRRWDHPGDAKALGGALAIKEQDSTDDGLKDGWIDLEDGVQIWFANTKGGQYRVGDYWLIPARTATGDVDWPHEVLADGSLKLDIERKPIGAALPPHGPRHYYAPLWLMKAGGQIEDCRCIVDHLLCP